jgi:hypothetical protein
MSLSLSRRHVVFYVGWLLAFIIVELPAVFSAEEGDTFTEMIRSWQGISGIIFWLVSGFAAWLWYHFTIQTKQREKDEG